MYITWYIQISKFVKRILLRNAEIVYLAAFSWRNLLSDPFKFSRGER